MADMVNTYSTSVLLGIFFATLAFIAWRNRQPKGLPPGPFDFPIVGTVLNVLKTSPHVLIKSLAEKYGDVFTLRVGPQRIIILNSAAIVKDALVNQAEVCSERFMPPVLEYAIGKQRSLIFGFGQENKERRKFVSRAFRHFGVGKKSLEAKLNEEAKYVIDSIDETEGKPSDLTHIINNAVSNIICSITFGDRFDYDDEKFKRLLQTIHAFTSHVSFFSPIQIFPVLLDTPLYSHIKKNLHDLKQFVSEIVNEHCKMTDPENPRDMLDLYLSEINRQTADKETIKFREDDAWRMFFELFLAGTDTTTNTLMFSLQHLASDQEIQRKICHEIETIIGSSRVPRYEDRKLMPYTEATILEVLRHSPAAPLGVPRLTTTECVIGGFHIPKGTGMLMNIWGIMHDAKEWENPDLFDPTRFLDENRNKVSKKSEDLLSFGTGRRSCLGENLAKMELFLFLTNILQRFSISFPWGKEDQTLEGHQGLSLKPKQTELCAVRR